MKCLIVSVRDAGLVGTAPAKPSGLRLKIGIAQVGEDGLERHRAHHISATALHSSWDQRESSGMQEKLGSYHHRRLGIGS